MYEICTLLSSFGQKMYGPKVLNILPFRFFYRFFSRFFDNSVRAFFVLFGQEGVCNFKITYLFQSLFSIIKV